MGAYTGGKLASWWSESQTVFFLFDQSKEGTHAQEALKRMEGVSSKLKKTTPESARSRVHV